MIRFRQQEDERRYLKLRSEVYRLVAAQLSPPAASSVLRNLGKLEQLLHLEGVRQGLAIAEISSLANEADLGGGVRSLKAFQAHATIYGSTDTPLTAVEEEWLEKLQTPDAVRPWLDPAPMRYAPQTLEEWEQGEAPPPVFERFEDVMSRFEGETLVLAPSPSELFTEPPSDDDELPLRHDPTESPAFLDRVRDALQPLLKTGWRPEGWGQLILKLHQELQVDAAYLDLQLSTDVGRAVLDQCGLFDMHPGHGLNLTEMKTR